MSDAMAAERPQRSYPSHVVIVPAGQLLGNRWNRKVFDPDKLQELSDNIKKVGIDDPLIIRHNDQTRPLTLEQLIDYIARTQDLRLEIADGERRWLAAKMADETVVPCIFRDLTDEEVSAMNLDSNLHNENLPILEQARMIQGHMSEFKLNQQQAQDRFGLTQGWISELLSLLKLPPKVLENIAAAILSSKGLRAIKNLPNEEMQIVISEKLKDKTIKPENVERECKLLLKQFRKMRNVGRPKKGPDVKLKKEPEADPFAAIWSGLKNESGVAPFGTWDIVYGGRKKWIFKANGLGLSPDADWKATRSALDKWLRGLSDALAFADPPEPAGATEPAGAEAAG